MYHGWQNIAAYYNIIPKLNNDLHFYASTDKHMFWTNHISLPMEWAKIKEPYKLRLHVHTHVYMYVCHSYLLLVHGWLHNQVLSTQSIQQYGFAFINGTFVITFVCVRFEIFIWSLPIYIQRKWVAWNYIWKTPRIRMWATIKHCMYMYMYKTTKAIDYFDAPALIHRSRNVTMKSEKVVTNQFGDAHTDNLHVYVHVA